MRWLGPVVIALLVIIFILMLQATEVVNLVPVMHEYVHILLDPSHTLVEFTFVLVDYLIIDAVKRRIVKHFHRDIEKGEHHV